MFCDTKDTAGESKDQIQSENLASELSCWSLFAFTPKSSPFWPLALISIVLLAMLSHPECKLDAHSSFCDLIRPLTHATVPSSCLSEYYYLLKTSFFSFFFFAEEDLPWANICCQSFSCFGLPNSSLFNSLRLLGAVSVTPQCMQLGNCHQAVSWGSCTAHFICFPFLKSHNLCCLFVSCLKILFDMSHLVFSWFIVGRQFLWPH